MLIFQLQEEAALTLKCMEKCRDGGFEECFMMKYDYPAKYDLCIRYNTIVFLTCHYDVNVVVCLT